MNILGGLIFSFLCYAAGIGSMAAFFVFIQFYADQPIAFMPAALVRDTLLFLLFPLQHTLFARPSIKARFNRRMNPLLYRPLFVGSAGVVMFAILLFWQPFGPYLYRVHSIVPDAIFYATVILIIYTTIALDHAGMFGLKQGYAYWKKTTEKPEKQLKSNGVYGIVRHPLTTLLIVALWSHATMTAGRLLFSVLFTAYALIGTIPEESDLRSEFGHEYKAYEKRVPGFIPRLHR